MEWPCDFTHIIGLTDPTRKTHAAWVGAPYLMGAGAPPYWQTVCGRHFWEVDVIPTATVEDGIFPSCKQCRKTLGIGSD